MLPRNLALVDDDSEFTEYLAQHLREQGIAVTEYHSADDLLADRRAFGFDFYVLDLGLPGIDGLELTRRLKRDPAYSGVVIVALSAYAMKGDEEKALAAGCDGYITKPIEPDTLLDHVRSALSVQFVRS